MSREIAVRKRHMVDAYWASRRGESFSSTPIADVVVGSGLYDRRREEAQRLLGDFAAAHEYGANNGYLSDCDEMERVEALLRRAGVDLDG